MVLAMSVEDVAFMSERIAFRVAIAAGDCGVGRNFRGMGAGFVVVVVGVAVGVAAKTTVARCCAVAD